MVLGVMSGGLLHYICVQAGGVQGHGGRAGVAVMRTGCPWCE